MLLPLLLLKFVVQVELMYMPLIENISSSLIHLHAFSSRTTLRLYDTPAIPKLVKEGITDLDLSTIAGLDCISEVVLKNCEPERSYIQKAELFPVYAFKNGEERPTAKNYRPVSVLFVASKIF